MQKLPSIPSLAEVDDSRARLAWLAANFNSAAASLVSTTRFCS